MDRQFPVKDVIPKELYDALDWSNAVIGGSYALKQFTGDTSWEPHDVDIMIGTDWEAESFEAYAKDFEAKTNAKKVSEATFDDSHPKNQPQDPFTGDNEMFHQLIRASKTYKFPGFDLPVQLIGVNTHRLNMQGRSVQAVLNITTDIPSCVSYSIQDNMKIFHIPEKGREILLTGVGKAEHVCPSRKEKYEARGYAFNLINIVSPH